MEKSISIPCMVKVGRQLPVVNASWGVQPREESQQLIARETPARSLNRIGFILSAGECIGTRELSPDVGPDRRAMGSTSTP